MSLRLKDENSLLESEVIAYPVARLVFLLVRQLFYKRSEEDNKFRENLALGF